MPFPTPSGHPKEIRHPLVLVLCSLCLAAACGDEVSYEPAMGAGAGEAVGASGTGANAGSTAAGGRAMAGTAGGVGAAEGDAAVGRSTDGGPEAGSPADAGSPGVVSVTAEEAKAILDEAPDGLVVLDIRTAGEYAAGHLPGAIQIDFYSASFEQELAALDRNVPYLMYCQSGGRSAAALPIMEGLGFREVYEIDSGYGGWVAAGFPTRM